MSNSPQNQDSLGEKLKAAFDTNNSDKNYNASKALASSIPAIGSLVEGFIDSYIGSPATKRMRKFLQALVEELNQVKSKIESVDFENPVFLTTFLHAYQIAARTHQEQKLEALKNVVLNSSIPRALEDDILAMFLNWIDYFPELHISTLKHLHYLDRYAPEQLDTYFPMLEKYRGVYNQVLKDLADRGLISLREKYITQEDKNKQRVGGPIPYTIMGNSSNLPKRNTQKEIFRLREDIDTLLKESRLSSQASKTTELGKEFIEFIESPSIQTESM
ncbi:hypothetical protein [Microcoleus sp. Pol12B4]|uniref:hypothetical protein n=1 Tax=Microcoleus sp. Pol12B4 TaxID=3055395 RepID=UPI002FD16580